MADLICFFSSLKAKRTIDTINAIVKNQGAYSMTNSVTHRKENNHRKKQQYITHPPW